MAVPKKKTSKSKTRSRRASAWQLNAPARSLCPRCGNAKTPARRVPIVRLVQRPRRRRRRLTCAAPTTLMLPVAVDAMGGDEAPGPILAGAHRAAATGIPIVLVGPSDLDGRTGPDGRILDLIEASEVIGMHDDPAQGVRRKKDSTFVRAAEAVRDGKASAMISAGNTGATMAAALLRMGRIPGVKRPAIATPIPVPGSTPTVLLDAGANAEVQAEWLVQFAHGRRLRPTPVRHRIAPGRAAVDR